jgi:cystathionine beta-lyase/cystathionine gamma-synthase
MKGPTDAIHVSEGQAGEAAPLLTPVYRTTTFLFESAEAVKAYNEGRSPAYLYSRYENPSVTAVERKVAALEGAETAAVFASGMAATATTLLAHTSPGDEIVMSAAVYGGTLKLADDLLARFGVTVRYAGLDDLAAPRGLFGPKTRLLWFESPINPTLRCVDVAALTGTARAAGVLSVVDSTFASPVNQQPLALGVDLVMESATKYLGGHSDLMAGVVAGPAALVEPILKLRRLLGGVLDPEPAYELGRSLKTLDVRVARHNENAQAVAEFLERDPRVARVFYPGLASHPDHALAARQMRGFGGMVTADLGSYDAVCRFFDALTVFQRAASLGGVESLCSLPVLTSQWGCTDEQLARMGVTRGMARLSVGLEDVEDLRRDLAQAVDASHR